MGGQSGGWGSGGVTRWRLFPTSSFLRPFFGFSRGFSSWLIQPAAENGDGWRAALRGHRMNPPHPPVQPRRLLLRQRTAGALRLRGEVTRREERDKETDGEREALWEQELKNHGKQKREKTPRLIKGPILDPFSDLYRKQ